MTTFRETIETYKQGQKETAYSLFLMDPNSNDSISFEKFCQFIDSTVGNVHCVYSDGKVKKA